MLRPILLSILMGLVLAKPGSTQELPVSALPPGARVRVTDDQGRVLIGSFLALEEGEMRWRPGAPSTAEEANEANRIPLSTIRRLEANRGRGSFGWRSFWITTGIMAGVGAGVMLVAWDSADDGSDPVSEGVFNLTRGPAVLAGAAAGALVGLPIGGAIAWRNRRERWIDVALGDADPSLMVLPFADGRVGFGLSLTLGR